MLSSISHVFLVEKVEKAALMGPLKQLPEVGLPSLQPLSPSAFGTLLEIIYEDTNFWHLSLGPFFFSPVIINNIYYKQC